MNDLLETAPPAVATFHFVSPQRERCPKIRNCSLKNRTQKEGLATLIVLIELEAPVQMTFDETKHRPVGFPIHCAGDY
jgi:hypothetical protein